MLNQSFYIYSSAYFYRIMSSICTLIPTSGSRWHLALLCILRSEGVLTRLEYNGDRAFLFEMNEPSNEQMWVRAALLSCFTPKQQMSLDSLFVKELIRRPLRDSFTCSDNIEKLCINTIVYNVIDSSAQILDSSYSSHLCATSYELRSMKNSKFEKLRCVQLMEPRQLQTQ